MTDSIQGIIEADRLIKEDLQFVVQQALDDGYTHGQVVAAFVAQAYTILRLTTNQTPAERKAFFVDLAERLADLVESKSTGMH